MTSASVVADTLLEILLRQRGEPQKNLDIAQSKGSVELVQAFAFFSDVPQSILYDNTKIAVAKILGDGEARDEKLLLRLQCLVGKL